MDVDARLDRMIEMADETGLTLDEVVRAVGRCDQSIFDKASGNPNILPRYIASSVKL
jgi:hypothetical protein